MIEQHATPELVRERYGWAEVDPSDPVIAGQTGTWRITYHAGAQGIDDGGVIKFAWRDVSDWAYPQFEDPAAPAYATVITKTRTIECNTVDVCSLRFFGDAGTNDCSSFGIAGTFCALAHIFLQRVVEVEQHIDAAKRVERVVHRPRRDRA